MRMLPILLTLLAVFCFGCASAPVPAESSARVVRAIKIVPSLSETQADKPSSSHTQSGKASYYADKFQGQPTASGEPYDKNTMTAAHRKLPFGTRVRVTNTANGKSIVVRINDRGPFVKGRIIDLSRSAFSSIGNTAAGVLSVTIEVVE